MADFLDKFNNSKNIRKKVNKQVDKSTTPEAAKRKVKTVKVTRDIYKQLKVISAMKDKEISEITDYLLNYGLDHSPKYHRTHISY